MHYTNAKYAHCDGDCVTAIKQLVVLADPGASGPGRPALLAWDQSRP
jgi:hypothetical protein